jgi:alkylation response protein AidB-like acyl-CoA dehydrogenase
MDKAHVRNQLADLWVDTNLARLLSYRVVSQQERGEVPNYEASIIKVFNSELNQRMARAGMKVLGLHGQLDRESPYARLNGRFQRTYLTSVGSTIAAGTSEIQRSIIATRGLGLPRG